MPGGSVLCGSGCWGGGLGEAEERRDRGSALLPVLLWAHVVSRRSDSIGAERPPCSCGVRSLWVP